MDKVILLTEIKVELSSTLVSPSYHFPPLNGGETSTENATRSERAKSAITDKIIQKMR